MACRHKRETVTTTSARETALPFARGIMGDGAGKHMQPQYAHLASDRLEVEWGEGTEGRWEDWGGVGIWAWW